MLRLNFLKHFFLRVLESSKQNCAWHIFTVSMLLVLNGFMKNLFITKTGDFKSLFVSGQNSKQYNKIGKH